MNEHIHVMTNGQLEDAIKYARHMVMNTPNDGSELKLRLVEHLLILLELQRQRARLVTTEGGGEQ